MKNFYIKTAITNLKKNLKLYVPQIIASSVMFGILYIMISLAGERALDNSRGGNYIGAFMIVGVLVMGILSFIIIFYSNNFLMKRRKREYGLYHVLGLDKRHVIKIMFFENVISHGLSIILGTVIGMLFYRLSILLIMNIYDMELVTGITLISFTALVLSVVLFAIIYLSTFIFNCISIKRLKTTELLASSAYGEKEPKVKWILFVLGLLSLGSGYYIAVTIQKPVEALAFFFLAVILVIIGTYFLFTAGSIFILKMLKKNSGFYYKPRNMISVSGMLYRMKQNAAGLASIAILATGVLIMIASTVTLYRGIDKTIKDQFPHDMYFNMWELYDRTEESEYMFNGDLSYDEIEGTISEACNRLDLKLTMFGKEKTLEVAYVRNGNSLELFSEDIIKDEWIQRHFEDEDTFVITFIDTDTYKMITGESIELSNDEMAFGKLTGYSWNPDSIRIAGLELKNVKKLEKTPVHSDVTEVAKCFAMVITAENLEKIYNEQAERYGHQKSEYEERFFADIEGDDVMKQELESTLIEVAQEREAEEGILIRINSRTEWEERSESYLFNGSLLFLGILLSIVCFFATALIIYYKQITEGYDDRNRFQIMEKVGLAKDEIKRTIRSQILMVFFIPLLVAGIHTLMAYPILSKMMSMLTTTGANIFLICIGVVFLIFSIVYISIYSITAKTYYRIVS
ncbi:MAG: hypothetical protein IKP88_10925 [Lachnospiraceae bacterium]|nr:hypothetical protein [Lachnospiraceae bacterium]